MTLRELYFQLDIKENASDFIKKVDKGFDNLKDKIPKTSKELEEMSKKMGQVGKDMTTKLTLPIVGFGVTAGKMAVDFETSIAKVSTIADETAVGLTEMTKQIVDLSNETGIAASNIAEDVYNAISAGQATEDAVMFVGNAAKLAGAGFAESEQALDLLTTIMNSYGLASEEVTNVSDKLIQIQNKGKTTVAELASTMGKAIPTAKAFGVDLDQLGAGFALMTSKGINTAETTTYISALMNELGKSGTNASKQLDKLTGKTFAEMMAEGSSLGDILALMDTEAKNTGSSLADMFGSAEAGKAAMILATDSGQAFNDLTKEMQGSLGATSEAFEKVSDTAGERFNKSMNKMKNAMIELGGALAPIIEKISTAVGVVADFISGMSPEQQSMLIGFAGAIAALGPVMSIVSTAMLLFSKIQMLNLIPSLVSGATAVWGFTAALLANPITWVIVALVALGVALWQLGKNWDAVSAYMKSVMERVKADFLDVKNRIMSLMQSINLYEVGQNIINGLLNGLRSMYAKAKETASNIASGIANSFKSFFGIQSPSRLMMEYGSYIGQGLDIGMQSTENNVKNTAESMGQNTESGISSMAGELWKTVTNIANGVAEKFKNFFGIASPSKLMFEYGGYIGQGLDLGMQSTENNVKNTAESMGQSAETGLAGNVTNSSNSFAPVVNITVNGSGGGARETASSVRKEVESVLSAYEKKMMLRWGAVNG